MLAIIPVIAGGLAVGGPATARSSARRVRPGSAKHGGTTDGCDLADAFPTRASLAVIRNAVVCEINLDRAAFGLPGVRANAKLDHAAQRWAHTMVATSDFGHGAGPAGRLSAAGFTFSAAGEAIAAGYRTPREVVAAWLASPDHCRILLSPTYDDAGTGVIGRPVPGAAISGATWVLDVALRFGRRAPSRDRAPARGCPY